MWLEARRFFDTVQQYEDSDDISKTFDLQQLLDKFKFKLQNLMVNEPKSAASRAKVAPNSKIDQDGVEIHIDASLSAESLIISDIFNLNELEAVNLVLAGESQKVHFDGINRGLVSVVCYYDAHRLIASALATMLKWDRETLPEKLLQMLDKTIVQSNVVAHLLNLLSQFTVQSEFNRLMQPNVNGIGGSKHQKLLRTAIEEIRTNVTEIILLVCENPGAQASAIASSLFHVVKNVPQLEKLNAPVLAAWLGIIKLLSSETLNQEAAALLTSVVNHIRDETSWSDQSMCGTMQLACAVSLKATASSPADHLGIENIKIDVDKVIDRAVRNLAFQYIRQAVIRSDHFKLPIQFVVVDELFKKLIAYFPAKLLEIERNSADELTWLEENSKKQSDGLGQAVTNVYESATLYYENFLRCIVDLYESGKSSKSPELSRQATESSLAFSTERNIELCRLLERTQLCHHFIHAVAYLDLCTAVCKNSMTAGFLFDTFSREYQKADTFGWDTLMTALRAYERLFHNHATLSQQQKHALRSQPDRITIPVEELSGLIAWLRIATRVAEQDESAAQAMADDRNWRVLNAVAGVAAAPIPLPLKAALLDFLTALARSSSIAQRVWSALHENKLCYFADNGALLGMQQELEEKECSSNHFEASLSFVTLLSTLLAHKFLPDFAAPFVQFVTKSILSQFYSRSYNDVHQMWALAEQALEATYQLLENGIVEPRAVTNNELHIAVLAQILNDTPFFRALGRILLEDCEYRVDPFTVGKPLSSHASLLSLRIISKALVLHPSLCACARVGSGDVIVASIQSLMFSPIHSASPVTILDIVFQYLNQADDHPEHALYAARMFRDVTSTRGTSQKTMLELLRSRSSAAQHVRAVRSALSATTTEYTIQDSLAFDEKNVDASNARGETARILLETLTDSIDALPSAQNVAYYLLAFSPAKVNSKHLYENDDQLTGLHFVIYIIEQFIAAEDPLSLPFSALLEPSFRLLQRLISVNCLYSLPVLCFLRSAEIIENLVKSPFIVTAITDEDDYDRNYTNGVFCVRKMITGYVFHFAAVEISTMLAAGHYTKPEILFKALLESSESVIEYTLRTEADENEIQTDNLLFTLLQKGNLARSAEISYPALVHFDANKLQEIFNTCLTTSVYGVSQYDVVYMHRLLKREIETVFSYNTEIHEVRREMEAVLEYCAEVNASLLTAGASERIVSGCTALLNVMCAFIPLPFFSVSSQLEIVRDACYVLINMAASTTGASLLETCKTLHKTISTLVKLADKQLPTISERRDFFAPMFSSLIELVILPGEKGIFSKISLYHTLRLLLRNLFEDLETDFRTAEDALLLDGHAVGGGVAADNLVRAVDNLGEQLARHVAASVSDLPTERKAAVILLMFDLLHEDMKGVKKFSLSLARSGVPRVLVDLLSEIDFEWEAIGAGLVTSDAALHASQLKLMNAILICLTRLAATEHGWNALSELAVTEVVTQLSVLTKAPKDVFLKPASVIEKGAHSEAYAKTLTLTLRLCQQMCTNKRWKKLSHKVLAVVQAFSEVLQQLLRAEIKCEALTVAQTIVQEISVNDEPIAEAIIEEDNVLRQLKSEEKGVGKARTFQSSGGPFATPKQLYSTLIRI